MQTDPAKQTAYSYGAVERALIAALDVPEAGLGSFRAKLTRVGQMGVPAGKARPGKQGGAGRMEYSIDDAHQLAIAMAFQALGVQPALGVGFLTGRGLWISIKQMLDDVAGDPNGSLFIIPRPAWEGAADDPGVRLMTINRSETKRFVGAVEVNVGRLLAKVDAALKKEG